MLKVAIAGLGYFSQFHLAAWEAHPKTQIVALCDPDPARRSACDIRAETGPDLGALLARTQPDIVDIIAPPPAHDALIRASLAPGRLIICQKPFATTLPEAEALTDAAEAAGATLVIHENFRFQAWYRAARDFLASGQMGHVYQARFDLRPGDGRGTDAYLARQPAFRSMPRLLIHETGVHFLDLFRWLFGDFTSLYADIRRLNPTIAGEDAGLVLMEHANGTRSIFDGNRLADHRADNPRMTMGEMRIEGEGGTLDLGGDGALHFRPFAARMAQRVPNPYPVDPTRFGGGCVAALIHHAIDAHLAGRSPENTARDYLHITRAVQAAYRSAETGQKITL